MSATNTRPASAKQLAFIERLVDSKNATGLNLDTQDLTSSTASTLIGELLSRPDKGEEITPKKAIEIDEAEYTSRLADYLANVPAPREYVRPLPHLKGADQVEEDCTKCGGSGLYANVSGEVKGLMGTRLPHWDREGAGDNAWCFKCMGSGKQKVKVSTVRARESASVKTHNKNISEHIAGAESVVREQMEREAEEVSQKIEAEIAAKSTATLIKRAEETRQEGSKITGTPAEVTKINEFHKEDAYSFNNEMILTRVITFTTAEGEEFVWFSSANGAFDLNVGDRGSLSATVKRVSSYNGEVQVQVIRAKLKGVAPATAKNAA